MRAVAVGQTTVDPKRRVEGTDGLTGLCRVDRERDALLASAGIMTLRFGFAEVSDDPRRCRRLAEKAIAARLAGFGSR